jgi:plastocyanin
VRRLVAAIAAAAVFAAAPAASAQGPVYQAVDDLATNHHRWEPGTEVAIQAGDTVTWRYEGTTLAHNVKATSANWTFDTAASTSDPTPVTYRFDSEGTYTFVCKFHADTMTGQVKVGNPPPPPPPPLSQQPFPNDQQPPAQLDVSDEKRPRLSRVRVAAVRDGARVRFRLSERARVSVRFKLAGLTVNSVRRTFKAGRHRLTVRDRRMHGRYRVEVFARDAAGNRSATRRATVRVRR